MKKIVKKIANKFGIDIIKLETATGSDNPYCEYSNINNKFIDVEKLGKMSLTIPGMITPQAGKFLYALCYMQDLNGDVVEVGSWQGRSSTFLARAVKESANGDFYAIDHFAGNKGKEKFYAIDGSMSSLKENFNENMMHFGLDKIVNLLDMVNTEAVKRINDKKIRFLFIDADHTKEGVQEDIKLFFPLLVKGSIVVFDDYFEGFPGLIEAIDEMFEQYNFERVFYYSHTLVIKL